MYKLNVNIIIVVCILNFYFFWKKEERMDKRIEKVIFKGLILVINKVCMDLYELNLLWYY